MVKPIIYKLIVAGIINHSGKVLILQRSGDDGAFPGLWTLPGGGKEPLEDPLNALVREVEEETGIMTEPVAPVYVFGFINEKKEEIRDVVQICYLVKPLKETEVKLNEEHQDFAWISEKEMNNYNLSKETKEAIYNASEYLKSKTTI